MVDELNPVVGDTELNVREIAGVPEASPEPQASKPDTTEDWRKQAENLSDGELMDFLEKHPKGAVVKERLGQSHADRVLLKDRERITAEVKQQVARETQETAWQQRWQTMSQQERGAFMLQNHEMQEQQGRMIGDWWMTQSQTVKNAIPELKGKSIEEWKGYFEKAPGSWGETMALLVEEVVKIRLAQGLEKEVPPKAKAMAEALLKEKVGKTLASSEGPDLRASGPGHSGTESDFVKAYAKGESNDHAAGHKWLEAVLKS